MTNRLLARAVPLVAALALAACAQDNTGDAPPPGASTFAGATFLIFPNPQLQADGTIQTNTQGYAEAYYRAIDPLNNKDTLAKWKVANGFDGPMGTQVEVVFGDTRDLGYGRRMVMRRNIDCTVAAYVENYLVSSVVDYSFSTLNLDAAVQRVTKWHVSTNAIEYSLGPNGGAPFLKFYQFDAATGTRNMAVDLDGRGDKFMPGPCISCHGGRADALTPPGAGGLPLFALVNNTAAVHRGDAQARMQPFDVDTFAFSATPGFTRAEQEAALKLMNTWVLGTYPIQAASAFPEDACRPTAAFFQYTWQGTAAELIKSAYGSNGLPNANFSDTYIPAGWAGQEPLYQNVVAKYCRACHLLRGVSDQKDPDFDSFAKFQGLADRIKILVFDRGKMPLAKIPFENFWSSGAANTLAAFLDAQGQTVARDGAGNPLRPGRPIADPGPSRTIRTGATTLSGANSLFSTTYSWSFVSNPGGATLTNPNSVQPTFNTNANGTYELQLVTGNGTTQSTPVKLKLVVNAALNPDPLGIRFADIKTVLQVTSVCTGCHTSGDQPPILYTNVDRDGIGGPVANATDDLWFYTELRGRINFTEIAASPLLRKPSGHHHGGNQLDGFDTSLDPGATTGGVNNAGRGNYDLFLNWILNGAPFQ